MNNRCNPLGKLGGAFTLATLILVGALAVSPPAAAEDATAIPRHFQASYELEAKGSFDLAINEMLATLRIVPGDYLANLRTGWLFYQAGRYEEAAVHYRKAQQARPRAVESRLGLMLPLMASLRYKEAEATGREVLLVDPGNYLARSRLAFSLYSLGRYKEAETFYAGLLEAYPGDQEMRLGLGFTLLGQGRRAEAQRLFEEVLRSDPQSLRGRSGLEASR